MAIMPVEGNITYDQRFGNHSVSALLLYNQRFSDGDQFYYFSFCISRAAYAYADRYIAEFNFGYNVSKNFAKRFGTWFFPSIAAGCNSRFGEEEFMRPVQNYINKLKLRASYGLAENDRF